AHAVELAHLVELRRERTPELGGAHSQTIALRRAVDHAPGLESEAQIRGRRLRQPEFAGEFGQCPGATGVGEEAEQADAAGDGRRGIAPLAGVVVHGCAFRRRWGRGCTRTRLRISRTRPYRPRR